MKMRIIEVSPETVDEIVELGNYDRDRVNRLVDRLVKDDDKDTLVMVDESGNIQWLVKSTSLDRYCKGK